MGNFSDLHTGECQPHISIQPSSWLPVSKGSVRMYMNFIYINTLRLRFLRIGRGRSSGLIRFARWGDGKVHRISADLGEVELAFPFIPGPSQPTKAVQKKRHNCTNSHVRTVQDKGRLNTRSSNARFSQTEAPTGASTTMRKRSDAPEDAPCNDAALRLEK
jgi:hypothetical protein